MAKSNPRTKIDEQTKFNQGRDFENWEREIFRNEINKATISPIRDNAISGKKAPSEKQKNP